MWLTRYTCGVHFRKIFCCQSVLHKLTLVSGVSKVLFFVSSADQMLAVPCTVSFLMLPYMCVQEIPLCQGIVLFSIQTFVKLAMEGICNWLIHVSIFPSLVASSCHSRTACLTSEVLTLPSGPMSCIPCHCFCSCGSSHLAFQSFGALEVPLFVGSNFYQAPQFPCHQQDC